MCWEIKRRQIMSNGLYSVRISGRFSSCAICFRSLWPLPQKDVAPHLRDLQRGPFRGNCVKIGPFVCQEVRDKGSIYWERYPPTGSVWRPAQLSHAILSSNKWATFCHFLSTSSTRFIVKSPTYLLALWQKRLIWSDMGIMPNWCTAIRCQKYIASDTVCHLISQNDN